MELAPVERVVLRLHKSHEGFIGGGGGRGDEVPEGGEERGGGEVGEVDCPVVVVVEDAGEVGDGVVVGVGEVGEEGCVSGDELDGVYECFFPVHTLDNCVIVPACEIAQELVPQTDPPDREHFPEVVLLLGEFEDVVCVDGVGVGHVEVHAAAGEEHPVELRELEAEGGLRGFVEDGDDEGAGGFQELDVGGGDVGVRGGGGVVLGVDSDDGGQGGGDEGKQEGEEEEREQHEGGEHVVPEGNDYKAMGFYFIVMG